jgi:cyanophycin synthetase
VGGRSFPLAALPAVGDVRWDELSDIPTALVTGSNGKTTTVRLLAACARMNGWHACYSCTDGVFIDDDVLATGDYSGPAGARMVLREQRTQAAIIETARGGILRRGIAVSQADVAVVTNVSSDHFGEYGIDDLAGLADTKLSVAAVVAPQGMLVLNADDLLLRAGAGGLARRFGRCPPLGWFALDADQVALSEYRARGASTCGVRDGRLLLSHQGGEHDLGLVSDMPLAIGGIAPYNVANLAAAALGAVTLGIPAAAISSVFARFGTRLSDNPGRMMRFDVAGARVLIDYAHNPEGLRGLLSVAEHLRGGSGRLCLLLGHAGNRQDADIEELARVAARFRPDLVVVKENDSQLRGRAPGEVPRILRAELKRSGLPESVLPVCDTEVEAARYALDWARPRDVLVFPMHSQIARAAVMAMLESMRPGDR